MQGRTERAIERGVAFLERTQLPNGELPTLRWLLRDGVATAVHDPTVFGPALIVTAIANVPGTETVVARAADFIASQVLRFGIWKYSPSHGGGYPPDLDDTSVACLALRLAGRTVPKNEHIFLANRRADGLFFTWVTPRLRWLSDPRMAGVALARWRHPFVHYRTFEPARSIARQDDLDAVVNANVLSYLGRTPETEPVIALLLHVLREGAETSCDKWYDNPFAVWYFFSRALRGVGVDARALLLDRLRSAVARTPLDHALAACVLLANGAPADEHIEAIRGSQQESGAWPAEALYGDDKGWGSESLTTAFCLEALARSSSRATTA